MEHFDLINNLSLEYLESLLSSGRIWYNKGHYYTKQEQDTNELNNADWIDMEEAIKYQCRELKNIIFFTKIIIYLCYEY